MSDEQGSVQGSETPKSLAETLDGFDMDVNPATGEFEFTPTQAPVVPAEGTPQPTGIGTQEGAPAPTDSQPAGNDMATLQKRLKDTQAALTQANQEKADMRRQLEESNSQYDVLNARVDAVVDSLNAAAQRQAGGEAPQAPEEFDAFETPQQLKAYLDSQVEQRARELLGQMIPVEKLANMTQDYDLRAELQEAVEKYGQEFVAHVEDVRQVINTYPQMTFSQAMDLVQSLKGQGQGNSSQTPNAQAGGTIPPAGQVTPATPVGGTVNQQAEGQDNVEDAIAARAQRMANVEHPTGGSGLGKPPVRTVRDAVNAALEELQMS